MSLRPNQALFFVGPMSAHYNPFLQARHWPIFNPNPSPIYRPESNYPTTRLKPISRVQNKQAKLGLMVEPSSWTAYIRVCLPCAMPAFSLTWPSLHEWLSPLHGCCLSCMPFSFSHLHTQQARPCLLFAQIAGSRLDLHQTPLLPALLQLWRHIPKQSKTKPKANGTLWPKNCSDSAMVSDFWRNRIGSDLAVHRTPVQIEEIVCFLWCKSSACHCWTS